MNEPDERPTLREQFDRDCEETERQWNHFYETFWRPNAQAIQAAITSEQDQGDQE